MKFFIISILIACFVLAFTSANEIDGVRVGRGAKHAHNQGHGRVLHVEKRNVRMADNGKFIVDGVLDWNQNVIIFNFK